MDATKLLKSAGIVPVLVIEEAAVAIPLAETLVAAGINVLEITLRTAAALQAMEHIANRFPELLVGAGSVRRPEHLEAAKSAGARFAVSPGFSPDLLDAASANDLPFVPGAATASEILQLQDHGYRLVKFFPAELAGGVAMIKALSAPIPEVRFFPTGGITPELARDYLAQPSVLALGGTWIAPAGLLAERDFAAISQRARDAVALMG